MVTTLQQVEEFDAEVAPVPEADRDMRAFWVRVYLAASLQGSTTPVEDADAALDDKITFIAREQYKSEVEKHLPGRHDQQRHAPVSVYRSSAQFIDSYDDVYEATDYISRKTGAIGYYITPDNRTLDNKGDSHAEVLADHTVAQHLGVSEQDANKLADVGFYTKFTSEVADVARQAGAVAVRENESTVAIDTASIDNSTLRRLQGLYDANKLGVHHNKSVTWEGGSDWLEVGGSDFLMAGSVGELKRGSAYKSMLNALKSVLKYIPRKE